VAAPRLTWDAYTVAWGRLHDGYDVRHASPLIRGWLRVAYGIGRVLARIRVSARVVTGFGLLLNLGVPVVAAFWGPWAAAGLVFAAAMVDTVDGAVALLTARATRLGTVYDALVHRFAEVSWLGAFWVLGAPGWLLVICGAVAWLHEYMRARAAAVGLRVIGAMTVGERSMRVSTTIGGLAVAGLAGQLSTNLQAGTVTIAAVVWIFLGVFGFVELLSSIGKVR